MSVDVDRSLRRWTGWTWLGYAAIWGAGGIWLLSRKPAPTGVESMGWSLLWLGVYAALLVYAQGCTSDTGGLALDDGGEVGRP